MAGDIFKSSQAKAAYLGAYDALLRLWGVPVESLYVSTHLGRTHILAAGDYEAPPVVLLPALSVSAAAWFASIKNLARKHRVYAPDIIGDAGKSVLERHPQHRSEYAFWLKQVFEVLEVYKPALVGHSYGGWLALNLASYIPEAVHKIVLVAPASGIYPFNAVTKFMGYMTRLPGVQNLPFQPDRKFLETRAAHAFQSNRHLMQMIEIAGHEYQPSVLYPSELSDDELTRITARILLLVGEHEPLYDPAKAIARASTLIPHFQSAVIPDAGHLLMMEKPAEVNQHILRFIEDAPIPVYDASGDETLFEPEYI
jgi:pimeloyl-ACP methyl ester carboxylesterase